MPPRLENHCGGQPATLGVAYLWEPACWRWGRRLQHGWCLTLRHRDGATTRQARSYRDFAGCVIADKPHIGVVHSLSA